MWPWHRWAAVWPRRWYWGRGSWAIGFFLFFGYTIHLVLDEVYSADLLNSRVKRSFGTALKLVDYGNIGTSSVMVAAMLAAYLMAPSVESYTEEQRQ